MSCMRSVPQLLTHALVEAVEGQAVWQRSLVAAALTPSTGAYVQHGPAQQLCHLTAAGHSMDQAASVLSQQPGTSQLPLLSANLVGSSSHLLTHTIQAQGLWPVLGGHWHPAGAQQQQVRHAQTKVIVEYKPLKEPVRDTYSNEPTNYLQLLGAIKAATNTDRLKYLIQNYAGVFDAVLLAHAISKLPRLAKYKPEDLIRGVITQPPKSGSLPALGPLIPRPGSRPRPSYRDAASNIAFQLMAITVGQSNVRLPGFGSAVQSSSTATKALQQGNDQGLRLWKLKRPQGIRTGGAKNKATAGEALGLHFMPQQAAACISALGLLYSMGVHLDPRLASATTNLVLDSLLAPVRGEASLMQVHGTSEDVAHILKGLAQLKSWPRRREPLQQLAAYCTQHAHRFSATTVQMALRSLVNLGYTDTVVMEALAGRARAIAKDFTPAGIAHILQALSAAQPLHAAQHEAHRSKGVGQATLEALAAGVAPQLVLMSPTDLAGLAASLGQLGKPYAQHAAATAEGAHNSQHVTAKGVELTEAGSVADTEGVERGSLHGGVTGGRVKVGNPAGLPSWLHSLASLLVDKAVRDMQELQPEQLASVLSMAACLQLPHVSLIQTVTDGILVENELDPTLSVAVGAAVVNTLSVLLPMLPEAQRFKPGGQDRQATLCTLLGHARKQAPPGALRYRQTAEGLGNLVGIAEQDELVTTALGPLQETETNTSHLLSEAAGRPRQYYQQLLVAATPLHDKVLAAAQRVMEVFTQPGAFSNATVSELADMATALRSAAATWPSTPLVGVEQLQTVSNQATDALHAETQALKESSMAPELSGHQAIKKLTSLLQLLQQLSALDQPSATLSAAAAMYLSNLLERQPQLAPQLLPTSIALLTACRQHHAEPTTASKVVAQAYAGTLGQAVSAATSSWPAHTASGLAPTPPTSQSRLQPWASVSGPMLAELLQVCAACGTLDSSILNAVAAHLPQLLSKGSQVSGSKAAGASTEEHIEWLVGCSMALAQEAEQGQKGNSQLSQADFVILEQFVSQLTDRLQARPQLSQSMYSKVQELQQQLVKVGEGSTEPKGLEQALLQLVGVAAKPTEKTGSGTARVILKSPISRQVLDNFNTAMSTLP